MNIKLIRKHCDQCNTELYQPGCNLFPNHSAADAKARATGWYVDAQQDLCPECRDKMEVPKKDFFQIIEELQALSQPFDEGESE